MNIDEALNLMGLNKCNEYNLQLLKKRYRELSKLSHPDNKNNQDGSLSGQFGLINEAYTLLKERAIVKVNSQLGKQTLIVNMDTLIRVINGESIDCGTFGKLDTNTLNKFNIIIKIKYTVTINNRSYYNIKYSAYSKDNRYNDSEYYIYELGSKFSVELYDKEVTGTLQGNKMSVRIKLGSDRLYNAYIDIDIERTTVVYR